MAPASSTSSRVIAPFVPGKAVDAFRFGQRGDDGTKIQERADQHAPRLVALPHGLRAVGGGEHERLAADALGREVAG